MMAGFVRNLKKNDHFVFGMALFLYASVAALAVQLVLLPYFFPHWHAGHGLLVKGDWVTYHNTAVEFAANIHQFGWRRLFDFWPPQFIEPGIAGVFYALISPEPWALIPFNAATHAASALFLISIFRVFGASRRVSFVAALPFAFYPSALTWYGQIHKDGWAILGSLSYLYGWVLLLSLSKVENRMRRFLTGFTFVLFGEFLTFFLRPYLLQISEWVNLVFGLVLITLEISQCAKKVNWQKILTFKNFLKIVSSGGIVLGTILIFKTSSPIPKGVAKDLQLTLIDEVRLKDISVQPSSRGLAKDPEAKPEVKAVTQPVLESDWAVSSYLPRYLDDKLYTIARIRYGFRGTAPEAGSNIDRHVRFGRAIDVIRYVPRALQIGILAPFPTDWFRHGKLEYSSFIRRVSVFETLGIYLSLPGLILAFLFWRKRPEFWLLIVFCLVMMLPYSLAVTNIGTLYRLRFGWLMVLVGLGISAWSPLLMNLKKRTI